MCSVGGLKEFINDRLSAAAAEIFTVVEQTIVRYQEEVNAKILDINWKPHSLEASSTEKVQHGLDKAQQHVCKEKQPWNQEKKTSTPGPEEPELPRIKEEPEVLQIQVVKVDQEDSENPQIEEEDDKPQHPEITVHLEADEQVTDTFVYLLAQSNRGDLLSAAGEIAANLPEMLEEVQEDECPDVTIPQATDTYFQSSIQEPPVEFDGGSLSPISSPFEDIGPITSTPKSQCEPRSIPGWEAVDALAEYLVSLNRTMTALSHNETSEILRLYSSLDLIDKSPTKYSLKTKKTTLPGPWRASRKCSGSAPGQQAAERLFMVHGQAAHRPDHTRVSECISLKLFREYRELRNRPKDAKGKAFAIPQSIVMTYSLIKQLIEDCNDIVQKTNLVLVTINNTTVSSWLQDQEKRTDRDSLLEGVDLLHQVNVAEDSLLATLDLPSEPIPHGHVDMEFEEPENREGEAVIPRRRKAKTVSKHESREGDATPHQLAQTMASHHPSWPYYQPLVPPPPPGTQATGWAPNLLTLPPGAYTMAWAPNLPPPPPVAPTPDPRELPYSNPDLVPHNRYREWRLKKAALEDEARLKSGEPPKKRQTKTDYNYQCQLCGKGKSKLTGHTQKRGKWYCPASGKTVDEWKSTL